MCVFVPGQPEAIETRTGFKIHQQMQTDKRGRERIVSEYPSMQTKRRKAF